MIETIINQPSLEPHSVLFSPEQNTLIDMLLNGISRIISKKNKIPDWVSAAVLCILIMVLGFGISYILKEPQAFIKKVFLIQILGVGLAYVSLIIFSTYTRVLFNQLSKIVDEELESESGKDSLRNWIKIYCNAKFHAVFCGVYGVAFGIYSAQSIASAQFIHSSYGLTTLTCLVAFIWGIPMYWLFVLLALPIRLGQYDYHLFNIDPASSKAIARLSGIFVGMVYLYGVVAMGTLIYLAYAGLLTSEFWMISIPVAWLPIILLFITGQWALQNIVNRRRVLSLNEIQEKIVRIQQDADLSEKDTMEKIYRLLEYHDRIKNGKNTAINLRSGIDFLNSLLLPVIGAIIGNIGSFLDLIDPLQKIFHR